jgi:hypothetical protein
MQLSAMRSYARKSGWTIAVEVQDVGSGVTTRPLREKLIETARRREIDSVIVWRLDRWGRRSCATAQGNLLEGVCRITDDPERTRAEFGAGRAGPPRIRNQSSMTSM